MFAINALLRLCTVYLPQCIGFKSGPELAESFASGDIFLFPSEVYSSSSSSVHRVDHLTLSNTRLKVETFGRVTLEACASGKPCIVDKGTRFLNAVVVLFRAQFMTRFTCSIV